MDESRDGVILTHLEDLQSEMEAGSRKLDKIRDSLLDQQLTQVANRGAMVLKLEDLRTSVRQQRETLRMLRQEIRAARHR